MMVGRSLVDGSLEPLAVLKSGGSWEKASLVAGQIADGPAWFTGVAVDPSGRVTMSHRPPSCWKARMPIAFSPIVRGSSTLAELNRLRAISRRRSRTSSRIYANMASRTTS